MSMAPAGHSSAQMPQPLQYSRSMVGGMVLVTTQSGQYNQQLKQPFFLVLTGIHLSLSIIGRRTLHDPVLPPSPGPGLLRDIFLQKSLLAIYFSPKDVFSWTMIAALAFSSGLFPTNSFLMAWTSTSISTSPLALEKAPMIPVLTTPGGKPASMA